jgi:capsular exopolysaccharide synthesis family protein
VAEPQDNRDATWLQPPQEQQGLTRFVQTLRERGWLVALTVVVTTAVAIAYVATATKIYEASADLLVSPVAGGSTTLASLGLIGASADPTRDVETASHLVTTNDVAERVAEELGTTETPSELLSKVEAVPVAQSNIIAVTARDESPEFARDLANAFAEQTVADRTEQLHEQIDAVIPTLETRLEESAGTVQEAGIQTQLARLETLRSGPDPTLRAETLADTPGSPVSPRPVLSVAGGILAGLVLGLAAAFAYQALDPRLRREEQLRRLYRLPILARIPREARAREKPLAPSNLSGVTLEAYRTLRGTLAASREPDSDGARTVLVTGSSPSEGKTTTAVNLAASLAVAGKKVILIEADLRRPAIAKTLDVQSSRGVVGVLIENIALEDALVSAPGHGSDLQLLLADYEGGWITELFSLPSARRLIEEAKRMADYVVVDSPPLTEVIDALPLARMVDDVLIVVRLGKSRLGRIHQLGELLAENGIKPAGFAVVGTPRPGRADYHYYRPGPVEPPSEKPTRRRAPVRASTARPQG